MTAPTAIALSPPELADLQGCETMIARGLETFVEVGSALATIRDQRLYREAHDTFESYCQARWGFTERRANQFVDAATVSELISGTFVPEINNEAQARELAPLIDTPEELQAVWAEAVDRTGGKPTAAAVKAVRKEREPNTKPEPEPVAVDGLEQPPANTAAAVEEAIGRHLPADPDAPHREWRMRFMDSIASSYAPLRFGVDDTVEHADDDLIQELARLARELTTFADKVTARRARPNNLRLIRSAS